VCLGYRTGDWLPQIILVTLTSTYCPLLRPIEYQRLTNLF
jgi:hypothetical protein